MVDNPKPEALKAPEIDLFQVKRIKGRVFTHDVVLDTGSIDRYTTKAISLESVMVEISIAIAVNMPRISGWNVYDESGVLILSVSALDFIQELGKRTIIGQPPADKGAAGWRAMPIVTATSQGFQDSMSEAKRDGRIAT